MFQYRHRTALAGVVSLLALGAAATGLPEREGATAPRVIQFPGSDLVVRTFEQAGGPHYAIDLGDGRTVTRATSYTIKLRYADFDPRSGVPDIPQDLRVEEVPGAESLYLVQFVTQPLEIYRQQLRELGAVIYKFVSNHAYVVRMTPEARAQVEHMPHVRWVGGFHGTYRLDAILLETPGLPALAYSISVFFEHGEQDAQKARLVERIAALGAHVNKPDDGKFSIVATLTPEQVRTVATWNEVMFIHRWSDYEQDMDIVRQVFGADDLENAAGYDGTDVRAEAFDSGFNVTHSDFDHHPLILHGTISVGSHGAATSGICFGDGSGNAPARGLNPNAQGIVADSIHFGLSGSDRYDSSGELVGLEAVYQTSSVGSLRTLFYDNVSAESDAAIFDFDVVHCQSQSNAGNQNSRPQAWAKNMVSGGGVYHFGTANTSDDRWNGGASIGPATDGRVKPTMTGFFDQISTVWCCDPTSYTTTFFGTSSATPIVCGHFGLLHQMWNDGIFGNEVDQGGSVFDNRPHVSTARALMINTADQYPLPAPNDITRYVQGWGRPNIMNLYDLRDDMLVIDETDVLSNLQATTYEVTVAGDMPLKVTMVYADPPGVPGASQHRINDLTLRVTSPADVSYWGNEGLITSNWSSPGGSANDHDVEENVFIENPEGGTWTVEVIASEINEDGHVETPDVDADYALVITGIEATAPGLPLDFTVTAGTYAGGFLGNLYASDDAYVHITQRAGVTPFSPLAEIEIESFSEVDDPSELIFTFEGAANALPAGFVPQVLELFNYDTNEWEEVDSRIASFNDSVIVITISADAGRFIDDGDLSMAARAGWYNPPAQMLAALWRARVDQATWVITP